MDAWVNSLILRQIYGTLPKKDVQFSGNGDYDSDGPYGPLSPTQVDAVLLGPSTDQAAAWALPTKQGLDTSQAGFFWNALAELRTVTGQDYTTASPAPALWYLARGTGNLYARTSWDASAYWSVFMAPSAETDHGHLAVSNFVFSHGGDHLIVDSSNYGEPATFETNAISADTGVVDGDYPKTQFNYPANALPWARGTNDGVFAARADVTDAFNFRGKADIPYAHREWTFLPEGEIVTIDRVHTAATSRNMYINFHANTGGTLKLDGTTWVATGTVGGSTLTIHPVLLSGGMPQIVKVPAGGCTLSCNYPCGSCNAARFAVDEYSLTVPGTWAVAIHVIDGLGGGDAAAQVGSLNDDNFDPAPKQNAGVIGAAVFRGSKQSYVVASSAQDGAAGASFSYGVPGASPGRHIVYDAPEASDGTSSVTAAAAGGRCVLTIAAGSGGGIAGHPLMFGVAPAGDGCTVAAGTDVAPGTPPPGGGVTPNPPGTGGVGGPGSVSGGCCAIASGTRRGAWTGLAMALACMFLARQQRRPRREAGSRSPLRDPE
jgi:hypothetical protein